MRFDMRTTETAREFLSRYSELLRIEDFPALLDHHERDISGLLDCKKKEIENISKAIDWRDATLVGTHVLGSIDDCKEIKRRGLMGLNEVLAGETLFSKFLNKIGVIVDVRGKSLACGNTSYDIDFSHLRQRRIVCGQDDAILRIARRVCCDSGMTAFLYSPNPKNYGTNIHLRPEFLMDLAKLYSKAQALEKWWAENSTPYKIDFYTTLSQIDYITFDLPSSSKSRMNESERVAITRWMIGNALLRSEDMLGESCIFLRPEARIPSSNFLSCVPF